MIDIATILPPRDGLPPGWEMINVFRPATNSRGYVRVEDDGEIFVMATVDAEDLLAVTIRHNNRELIQKEALDILAELFKTRELDYVTDYEPRGENQPLYFVAQLV